MRRGRFLGILPNMDKLYDTLLLDLDGTLLDYASAQEYAAEHLAAKLGMQTSPETLAKIKKILQGKVIQDIEACRPQAPEPSSPDMAETLARAGVDVDPASFVNAYFEGLSQHGEPLEGVRDFLASLKGKLILGVVTNGPGPVQRRRLLEAELMEFPDLLVVSCEVGTAKPDPEILEIAVRLAGSEKNRTLFVGDSAGSDMAAAKAAGIDFVYVRRDGDFSAPGPRILELERTADLADFPGLKRENRAT